MKHSPLRRALALGALGTLAAMAAPAAQAQGSYPASPITLVVPFAAGSGTDAVARLVATRLGERLRQPVIVDNKAGANAQIAANHVAKARPDGYTLFMTTTPSHSANPWLVKGLKYDPVKDFTPVARVGELPFALLVHPSVPARTVQELIDYAKANPDRLSYGTPNSTWSPRKPSSTSRTPRSPPCPTNPAPRPSPISWATRSRSTWPTWARPGAPSRPTACAPWP
jgi:tripartite-type tricarboxylate transporter receptor subunit TctC